MALSVVNWNVEWATPRSERSPEIVSRIDEHCPEIICLTETSNRLWDRGGYAIWPQPYYGYPVRPGRRKVVLWSREPWRRRDWRGSDSLPPGRFVSGVTQSSIGPVTVMGICIPWRGSRTPENRGNRRGWQDHMQYLDGLDAVLERAPRSRLIVAGDFNQGIGGVRSVPPQEVRDKLQSVIAARLNIVTSHLDFQGRKAIDHIAISDDLCAESIGVISNCKDQPQDLSDHFGVVATLTARK